MVLGVLESEFTRVRRVKDERDAEREKLLIKVNSRRASTSRSARRELETKFGDDPAVIEALELKATDEMIETEQLAAQAAELLAQEKFDEAMRSYEDVLSRTNDDKLRKQALTNLKLASKEVARGSQDLWTQAVIADASRDLVQAEALYEQLAAEHPANPSAKVRLGRLQ
jgi:outer membrane protein assembly factor BamD (BamD/ComL family)